jgi:hypothetical protein
VAPASGAVVKVDHPTFSWKDPDAGTAYEALSYTFGIADKVVGQWIKPWVHTDQTTHQWSGPPALVSGHSYSWFVVPTGRRGQGVGTNSTFTYTAPVTPPSPPSPPAVTGGYSKVVVWNCNASWESHDNGGTVTAYINDHALGAGFKSVGTITVGYPETESKTCGPLYTSGTSYDLEDRHVYDFVFVDPELPGCDDEGPTTIGCQRTSAYGFVGKKGGPVLQITIS